MKDGPARLGAEREPIGYAGLIAHYRLDCPLPRQSLAVGPGVHRVVEAGRGTEWKVLPRGAAIRLPRTAIEHLGIALKHEGVDLCWRACSPLASVTT